MRFRPFGGAGVAVSSVSLVLTDREKKPRTPQEWARYIHSALEAGINSFEVEAPDVALIYGLAEGLGAVERRLVFVTYRAGAFPTQPGQIVELSHALQKAADESTLNYFDLLMVDEPTGSPTRGEVAGAVGPLQALSESGIVRFLGVRGENDGLDSAMQTGAFDAIATPYSLASGWRERHRIKEAAHRDVAVIGLDTYPEEMVEAAQGPKPQRSRIWRRKSDPLSGSGSYVFLNRTQGWTAEEICLSYALTEPALATVLVSARDEEHMNALADVPDRDMPAGVAAQIEMARFSEPPAGGERRRA
jgi:aryl-alcohol dehydrogenase-like predicted oxidoreductase